MGLWETQIIAVFICIYSFSTFLELALYIPFQFSFNELNCESY